MNFAEEVDLLIRSKCNIIYIQTVEEERILNELSNVSNNLNPKRAISVWDFATGYNDNPQMNGKLADVLGVIIQAPKDTSVIYVLKDFHRFINDNTVCRMLRNLSTELKTQRKSIVIISPVLTIPTELEEDIHIMDYELPSYNEIQSHIKEATSSLIPNIDEGIYESLSKAFQGLTINKIRTILSKSLALKGTLDISDIDLVLEEKRQVIKRTEVLEFFNSEENIADIGGMDVLKKWIVSRGAGFTEQAKNYGLPYPKGVLMVGIQGTGKSLCAKAISKQWKMPLLRLDVGRLMGSLVGESENKTRQMIKTAEAMAPCVVWIDEIDKAFAGIGGYQGDSGTQSRIFGSLITWMQEKKSPVFIVATANNIDALPAELLRKGRFDEIYFVNLPNEKERKAIFDLHIKKRRGLDSKKFDTDLLSKKSEGFSGAEIEQAIIDAMFTAFSEQREFNTEDIENSISQTVPLSITAKDKVDALVKWAESGKARMASSSTSNSNNETNSLTKLNLDSI